MLYREFPEGSACRQRCPARIDIPRYVRLAGQRKYDEALAVIRERTPFPGVLGHVCPRPCEKGCQDTHLTEPVAINALKRFLAGRDTGWWKQMARTAPPTGRSVAIVGSGPAGLTAAYYLARLGHRVTVFEALPEAGGMMRAGIPGYRLPRDVLNREIDEIRQVGVDIKTGSKVENVDTLFRQGYDAVLLSVGTHRALKLRVPGEDSAGVMEGITFLREVNLGKAARLTGRVGVIGGGNVAIDAARTSLRLGAKEVHIVCLEAREGMLASKEEVQQAVDEGVILHCSWGVKRIQSDGKRVSGIDCVRCTSVFNKEGKFSPTFNETEKTSFTLDNLIVAIGQAPDLAFLGKDSKVQASKVGRIKVRSSSLKTGATGVFAAGDAVSGPTSVVEAIAAGRRAASSVDRYFGGRGAIDEVLAPPEVDSTPFVPSPVGKRTAIPHSPVAERLSGFTEVELGFNEEMALREASRCYRCDLPIVADPTKCTGCMRDGLMCSVRWTGAANPRNAKIRIVPPDRSTHPGESEISFAEDCDGCGICVMTCPYGSLTRQARR